MRRFDPDDIPEATVHAAALAMLADKMQGEAHDADVKLSKSLAAIATGKGVDYACDGTPVLDASHAPAVLAAVNAWIAARFEALDEEAIYSRAIEAAHDDYVAGVEYAAEMRDAA